MTKSHSTQSKAAAATTPRIDPPLRRRALTPTGEESSPTLTGRAIAAAKPQPPRRKSAKPKPKGVPGDYDVGKYKPPLHTRFQPGNPGGPGRRKGSRSQDSFLRDELNSKLTARIEGRETTLTKRQLATKMWVKAALEKQNFKHLMELISEGRRLFPEAPSEDAGSPLSDSGLDALILSELFASFTMGEADPGIPDALADLLSTPADLRFDQEQGGSGIDGEAEGAWQVDERGEAGDEL